MPAVARTAAVTQGTGTGPFTASVLVTSGDGPLYVWVHEGAGSSLITGVTYGGTPLTQIAGPNTFNDTLSLWALDAPTPGTANVSIAVSASATVMALIGVMSGANAGTPDDTPQIGSGTSAAASWTSASDPGDLVLAFGYVNNATIAQVNSPYTREASIDGSSETLFLDSQAGAASVTFTYTNPFESWGGWALNVNAGAAGSPPRPRYIGI